MKKQIEHEMCSEVLNQHDPSVGIYAIPELRKHDIPLLMEWIDSFENMQLEGLGEPDERGWIKEFIVRDEGELVLFQYVVKGYDQDGEWVAFKEE